MLKKLLEPQPPTTLNMARLTATKSKLVSSVRNNHELAVVATLSENKWSTGPSQLSLQKTKLVLMLKTKLTSRKRNAVTKLISYRLKFCLRNP